jgi:hypothetical protein
MRTRPFLVVLLVLAVLEIGTLGVLVVNLAVVHHEMVARVIGPIHGAVYLVIVLLGLLAPGLRWRVRILAVVPVVGGVLAATDAWRTPTAKERA